MMPDLQHYKYWASSNRIAVMYFIVLVLADACHRLSDKKRCDFSRNDGWDAQNAHNIVCHARDNPSNKIGRTFPATSLSLQSRKVLCITGALVIIPKPFQQVIADHSVPQAPTSGTPASANRLFHEPCMLHILLQPRLV